MIAAVRRSLLPRKSLKFPRTIPHLGINARERLYLLIMPEIWSKKRLGEQWQKPPNTYTATSWQKSNT